MVHNAFRRRNYVRHLFENRKKTVGRILFFWNKSYVLRIVFDSTNSSALFSVRTLRSSDNISFDDLYRSDVSVEQTVARGRVSESSKPPDPGIDRKSDFHHRWVYPPFCRLISPPPPPSFPRHCLRIRTHKRCYFIFIALPCRWIIESIPPRPATQPPVVSTMVFSLFNFAG